MEPNVPVERIARRERPQRLPVPVSGEPGLFTVDATWGTVQPLQLPGGVETVGELEVAAAIASGATLIDTRQPAFVAAGTLPTARPIRHQEIVQQLGEWQPEPPLILFCNGPQCAATPQAITALLDAGWDPADLRYYRGGIHDWVTLGYPLVDTSHTS